MGDLKILIITYLSILKLDIISIPHNLIIIRIFIKIGEFSVYRVERSLLNWISTNNKEFRIKLIKIHWK